MGNTLDGQTVVLFGQPKDIFPHPIITLGVDATGQPQPILVSPSGAPLSTVSIDQTTLFSTNGVSLAPSAYTNPFTITTVANGVTHDVAGYATVSVQATAYSGNGQFQGSFSNDGTTWTNTPFRSPAGASSSAVNSTALRVWNCTGFKYFRLTNVDNTTGSLTYTIYATQAGVRDGASVDIRSVYTQINADAQNASQTYADTGGLFAPYCSPLNFNGTNWDRNRGNIAVVLLASAARTTTQTSADIVTYNASGIHVTLSMTVVGTGSVTVLIEGKDANGIYYTLLSGVPIITNSVNVYKIGRGITAVANGSASDYIPRTIRITVTANNANSATYSAAYSLMP